MHANPNETQDGYVMVWNEGVGDKKAANATEPVTCRSVADCLAAESR